VPTFIFITPICILLQFASVQLIFFILCLFRSISDSQKRNNYSIQYIYLCLYIEYAWAKVCAPIARKCTLLSLLDEPFIIISYFLLFPPEFLIARVTLNDEIKYSWYLMRIHNFSLTFDIALRASLFIYLYYSFCFIPHVKYFCLCRHKYAIDILCLIFQILYHTF